MTKVEKHQFCMNQSPEEKERNSSTTLRLYKQDMSDEVS